MAPFRHWLLTMELQIHLQCNHMGFVVDRVALVQVFLWIFQFCLRNHPSTSAQYSTSGSGT